MLRRLMLLALATAVPHGVTANHKSVDGGSCTEDCRSRYNECRLSTKGSPSCDAEFAVCMRRCIDARSKQSSSALPAVAVGSSDSVRRLNNLQELLDAFVC